MAAIRTAATARAATVALAAAAVALAVSAPVPAVAAGGAEEHTAGQCTGASNWQLTVKERDGGLEIEFDVDENMVGSTWNWQMFRAGVPIFDGTAQTVAPSGSFSADRFLAGAGIGTDIAVRAVNAATAETCATPNAPASTPPGGGGTTPGTGGTSPGTGGGTTPGTGTGAGTGSGDGAGAGGDGGEGAQDGGDDAGTVTKKRTSGKCTAGSKWKLKVKTTASRVRIEFEVDSGTPGQRWSYRVAKGGEKVMSGKARTSRPSGSLTVTKKVRDPGGTRVSAKAARRSGERCTGSLRVG